MDIIIEISCAGKPILESGRISASMPSVREIGDVVSVKSWEQSTSRIRRTAMNSAVSSPLSVI